MSVQWGFMKFKGDAQACYDEVQTLGESYTPHQVLDLARNPKTELHKCFDWDDSSAAEKWRVQQARFICKSFTVVIETSEDKEPQRFRVIQHDKYERVYRPIVFSVRNDDQYARLLKRAKEELTAFKRRYKSITELDSVIDEIDRVLNQ